MSLSVLILAAGKGSRMKSKLPKVLHEVGNAPMIYYPIDLAKRIQANKVVTVIGKKYEHIKNTILSFSDDLGIVEQPDPLGTGHAVLCAKKYFEDFNGNLLILLGDCPFISEKSINNLINLRESGVDLAVLGFNTKDAKSYGRLVLDANGELEKIVEANDATPQEEAINFCNSGVMIANSRLLFSLLERVSNSNTADEFYLTDIVALAKSDNLTVGSTSCSEKEAQGINDHSDLAAAEEHFQNTKRVEMMRKGITLIASSTIFFSFDTTLGSDTVVEPNVVFGPGVNVGSNVRIKSFSHLEGCLIKSNVTIGPFARIRPETVLNEGVKIGNFVEIKKSTLQRNVKANHLSYIGDASIGEGTNVGAGTVFCNYDGSSKSSIEVGENSFIGSNVSLVAPLAIGDRAILGAGSTITDDVPKDSLALGRNRQINKTKK